jgi:hypothetical protein
VGGEGEGEGAGGVAWMHLDTHCLVCFGGMVVVVVAAA